MVNIRSCFLCMLVCVGSVSVAADELADKIKVGTPIEVLPALLGGEANSTACQATLGVITCKMTWIIGGIFSNVRVYEVTSIAGRVVSVSWSTKRGICGVLDKIK